MKTPIQAQLSHFIDENLSPDRGSSTRGHRSRLVLEQEAELGFPVAETVGCLSFNINPPPRVQDHPLLAGNTVTQNEDVVSYPPFSYMWI